VILWITLSVLVHRLKLTGTCLKGVIPRCICIAVGDVVVSVDSHKR